MEIMSVLLPTSFSTVKLALSVWRKHKHVRTVFTSMLISLTFGPYTHSPQGHPHVHIHACVCTHMHTLSSILTTLSTLRQTHLHTLTHTFIYNHESYLYSYTHLYIQAIQFFFFF